MLAAACSSSSGGAGGGASAGSSTAAGKKTPASAAVVTITVVRGRLTAPNGHTLYYNTVDTATTIKCVGGCASEWPPLAGKPEAGAGLDAEDLATTHRPDGSTQITFYGHPLYQFSGDRAAGTTKGDGVADEGGKWVVATPDQAGGGGSSSESGRGSSSPAPAKSDTSSGGGGYGYP